MSVELVPSSRFSHAELAVIFTASFRGYALPMQIDEPTFSRMVSLFDFDLDASRVAARDGREIGLVNLGVRGRGGWIGGTGVVPDERRRGVGELLMHGVHDAGATRGFATSTSGASTAARELLVGVARMGRPVRMANLPADDPVGEAFRELGGSHDLRQRELRLEL